MKHVGNILKSHIESHAIPKNEVAASVGIAYNYLSTIFNKPSIKSDLLEKFCQCLHISPLLFFDVEAPVDYDYKSTTAYKPAGGVADASARDGNKRDEALLIEKERVIAAQAETISLLKHMLGLSQGSGAKMEQHD